jgi:Ca2+-binding RTX toxin-like protein
MSIRFLAAGLAAFAALIFVAAWPVVARGHTVNTYVPCTIVGTDGPDLLVGTNGSDVICAKRGADVVTGHGGNDIIKGGRGSDTLYGDLGKDVLVGGAGNDWLYARDSVHDHVLGGTGTDHANVDKPLDYVVSVEVK